MPESATYYLIIAGEFGHHLKIMFSSSLDDQGLLGKTFAKSWYTFNTCAFSGYTFAASHDVYNSLHNSCYICVLTHQ